MEMVETRTMLSIALSFLTAMQMPSGIPINA